MPSPFIPFDTQYSEHTDITIHPVTGVVYITVSFHPNNRGGYNCKLWELHPPYTGRPVEVRNWVQGRPNVSVGPFGHGHSIALPTGGVLTAVPVATDSSEVEPSIMIDMGLGAPYQLGTGGGGGGGVNLLPAVATAPAWEAHSLTTGILVDIPSVFNVPRASAYLVRFTVNAPVANVRGRAGTEAVPYFFTVNSRADGSDEMQQGWVPGPSCYISPAQGTPTVWFQIVGYS